MQHTITRVPCLLACLAGGLAAQLQVVAPYNNSYIAQALGSVPGVPTNYGGLTIQARDPNYLLIGGAGSTSTGALYRIRLVRNGQNHITGFTGTATRHADAAYNDGGVVYGPNDVLFLARWPVNEVGQTMFNSAVTDRIIPLSPAVSASPGSLTFVPLGFASAGNLKICGYTGGPFYDATISPDGNGTFNINNITFTNVNLSGGPEGIAYIPPRSPLFFDYQSMLVCEYNTGQIAAYDVDGSANPVITTRRTFITGLTGADGATIDPATGDFLFSTFGGGNQVVVVTGFGQPCASFANYGTGLGGTNGRIPTIGGSGCASRNLSISIDIGNGLPNGGGILVLGAQQANVPIFGGALLVLPRIYITHTLGSNGMVSLPAQIPDDGSLVGADFYTQSFYVDPGAPQLISMTNGLTSQIR